MAELVELPAGVGLEEDPGPVVAEARSAGLGAEVTSRRSPSRSWAALGEEHRATAAATKEPWQELRGAR